MPSVGEGVCMTIPPVENHCLRFKCSGLLFWFICIHSAKLSSEGHFLRKACDVGLSRSSLWYWKECAIVYGNVLGLGINTCGGNRTGRKMLGATLGSEASRGPTGISEAEGSLWVVLCWSEETGPFSRQVTAARCAGEGHDLGLGKCLWWRQLAEKAESWGLCFSSNYSTPGNESFSPGEGFGQHTEAFTSVYPWDHSYPLITRSSVGSFCWNKFIRRSVGQVTVSAATAQLSTTSDTHFLPPVQFIWDALTWSSHLCSSQWWTVSSLLGYRLWCLKGLCPWLWLHHPPKPNKGLARGA